MRGGIIQEIVTLIKNRNLIEHLEVEEEWVMQHIWNHKEDVDSSTLLEELQAELPELKRSHMIYLLQRCAEKEYIGTYRKGAYSARTAHPFRRNGAPFRFKLSKAQLVD